MKKILLFAASLCLIGSVAYSAPSVSSYSGTMGDGQAVTVSGSGFGTNTQAGTSAIEFLGGASGPIESGTTGQPLSRSRWSVDTGWGYDMDITTNNVPWGTKVLQMTGSGGIIEAPLYYNLPTAMVSGERIFVSWWERVTWTGNGQYKIIRFSPTQTIVDSSGQQTVFFFHNNAGAVTFGISGGPYMLYPSFSPASPQSIWTRFDVDMTLASSGGTAELTKYTPGSSLQTTSGSGQTFGTQNMNYIVWQNYFGTDGSGDMSAGTVWLKDLYISHGTKARVEICDTSTWAARKSCTIQPASSWSASSATVTVNRGPFAATAAAYLYVVDSAGAANSSGYAITFGDTGADTSAPYPSQWSPAKNATGVAATNRTIHFHIQDDVDVLTANGVVNIEGTNYTCSAGLTCTGNGTSDVSITYTKGSDWTYDQVVNVSTSGFRDTAGNVMATDTWSYTIASNLGPGAPNITTTTLSAGTVGTAASQTFAASGGTSPYTWSLLSGTMPPGKTLSSGGVYSGTPTTAGTYSFTVAIVDAIGGIDNQALSQTINAAAPGGQVTTTITNIEDTYINSGAAATNYSGQTYTEAYQWPLGTVANRQLFKAVLGLPDNVSILSAKLYLNMTSHEGSGGTDPMRLYAQRVSDNVPTISTATWSNFPGTLQTYESGTDVSLVPGWYSWDITTMTSWAYANASDLYLAIDGRSDGAADTNRIFASMEAAAEFRPYITVTYMNLVEPGGPSISAPGKMRVSKMKGVFH